jgi:hypothetical protein
MRHFQTAVLLALSLGSTRVFAEIESRGFRGTLLETRTEARLQKVAAYLAPDDATGPHLIPVERMSRTELNAELERLERERPGLGGPIALMAIGGALTFPAVYLLVGAISGAGGWANVILGLAGVILSAAAVTMVVIGIVLLVKRIPPRNQMAQRMDDLKARLDTLNKSDAPSPPSYDELPPPPPPPPPAAGILHVDPQWVVATF